MSESLDDVDRAILRGDYDDGTPVPPLAPDWQISDEELMQQSPAAVAARKMMSGMSPEQAISDLRRSGVQVEVEGDYPYANPGPDPDYPDRPDHPDFRLLSRIVQDMDATGEAEGFEQVLVPVDADIASLTYMARQRVQRAQKLLTEASTAEAMGILWVDAFTAGALYGRERAVRMALDESIENGSRRSRGV